MNTTSVIACNTIKLGLHRIDMPFTSRVHNGSLITNKARRDEESSEHGNR